MKNKDNIIQYTIAKVTRMETAMGQQDESHESYLHGLFSQRFDARTRKTTIRVSLLDEQQQRDTFARTPTKQKDNDHS